MLTVPTPSEFSYYSDKVLHHQSGQGLICSIAVIVFNVLTGFQFVGACCDNTVWFTCYEDRLWRNEQSALAPLVLMRRECVGENGLNWFLEASSFDPIRSVVAVLGYAEVDWTALGSRDTLFPYHCETAEVFDLPEGHKTVLPKWTLHGDVSLSCRAPPARALPFARTDCFRLMRLVRGLRVPMGL